MFEPTRYLIVGPSWVGDMVMAQSLFKLLKSNQPESEIAVLAPAWSEPVLARMPEVDRSIEMPVGHNSLGIRRRYHLAKEIKGQFDQAVVMPGSLKSALVPWFARIPVRTGFVGEQRYGLLNDIRKLDKQKLPLHAQRVAALGLAKSEPPLPLEKIPKPELISSEGNRSTVSQKLGINPEHKSIVLCPGAEFGPAKQWPAGYFAAVANWGVENGYQILIMGSSKDAEIAASIARDVSGIFDLTGKTSLGDAIDLMSLGSHVVSNDSGLMHIAAALGCNLVAIYGSSSDRYTPPLSESAVKLSLELECQPCFQRSCPLGHLNCLNDLPPEKVIDVIVDGGDA
ncbi:MAG: lipopolysaccharide heptosyltransferase II [Acidiferrobacterales bacterium]|nr:lipopolysaccharide heptosyltransferase II [Acidiferrobacterales bacterium]